LGVDDRVAQYLVSIGKLCADARVGRLAVQLRPTSGDWVVGVPEAPREAEGGEQLDDTGYADAITVDGVAVRLSDVIEASIRRPAPS
jgi:hypothetical protein